MSSIKEVRHIVSASGTISVWILFMDGDLRQFCVDTDHKNHRTIAGKLKQKNYTDLVTLCEDPDNGIVAKRQVVDAVNESRVGKLVGKAEIVNGVVYVNDVPIHNVVSERILNLHRGGYPIEPALRFLELLLQNPSPKAQEELYDFLAHKNLPLTEDGHFLGYKRVRADWLDVYSETIDNSVGRVVSVPRSNVDDDRNRGCSNGLHVGTLNYVRGYSSGGHVVIVKVSPEDCVSVPLDHNHEKLRTCRYEVLYELPGDSTELQDPVYSTNGDVYSDAREFSDDESDEDQGDDYWREGWDDEYEDWTKDELADACRDRKLTTTRQEGRDMGRDAMINLLRNGEADPIAVVEEFAEEKETDNWQSSGCEWESSNCW